jgi:Kef-type K+ transport system membrane component KefB
MNLVDVEILLVTLGALLILGLIADLVGRRTALPRVTLLIILGFLVGSSGLDLLPESSHQWFPVIATMALAMVGFLLGGSLTLASMKRQGKLVIVMSVAVVAVTALIVLVGLLPFGLPIAVPVLFAGIATSTDPVATVAVIDELKSRGPFSDLTRAVVAIDDAWGLIVFSMLAVMAATLSEIDVSSGFIVLALQEVGGGILLGLALGIPMAYLTGRVKKGEPTQSEALGLVLLCGGLALWMSVSFLLAAMAMGMTVVNLAKHHTRPFHAIEGIEWPFIVLFFVLSGASVEIDDLPAQMIWIVCAYVLFRLLGRIAGGVLGAVVAGKALGFGARTGLALLPQAGVALGVTLIAAERFPDLATTILPTVVAATVIFEMIGPIATRYTLKRSGEVDQHS